MKIDFKKIINIKNKSDLKSFPINEPLFQNNYIYHYLVLLGNIDAIKLEKFPVYVENNDNLNCFHLAAKENNIDILCYLIDNYKEYIYNRNSTRQAFTFYFTKVRKR